MTTRLRAAAAAAALALASACAEPAPAPTDPGLSLHRDGADHRTIVVDPAGHGGRPTTIQAGIDQAPAGGRVLVLPGTYSEAIVINKGLTLQGLPSRHERVTIAPAGTPTIAVQVATVEPVTIRSLGVRFSGANGIRGDGAVDLTVEHASVTAVNAPLGVSHLVAVFNNAPATGRARLVVRHSFIDGNVAFTNSPTPAFPQSFGLRIQGDVDGVFAHNTIRRSGGACVFVTTRLDHGGETNADILENDIDECYPIGRAGAILVGPTGALPVPLPPFTATGRVNTIGNTIRNSSGSCLPLAAINYEGHGGRIEHNQILDFVQPCATEGGTRTLLGAIFVGSQPTRGFPPVEPVIRFNDIVGNAHAGLRLAANMTTPIDARCNYWGTATGPTVGAVIGSDVVMEAGAATPVLAPFATGPIADRRRHGHGGDRHGHGSCSLATRTRIGPRPH